MKLHTKYQSPGLSTFTQDDFQVFSYMGLCKTCDPLGGTTFDPEAVIRTILEEVLLDKAIYQISRL